MHSDCRLSYFCNLEVCHRDTGPTVIHHSEVSGSRRYPTPPNLVIQICPYRLRSEVKNPGQIIGFASAVELESGWSPEVYRLVS